MSIWQEWTTNNKYNKLKKNKMSNMNTKETTQRIFTMGILITMRRLIRKNRMGYYKIIKENKNFHQKKDKDSGQDAKEGHYTQDMQMDHPEI